MASVNCFLFAASGTVITTNAFAFDCVRMAIGWCGCGTDIAGGDCTGQLMSTLGLGAGPLSTLGVGAPSNSLGGGASGVTGSG